MVATWHREADVFKLADGFTADLSEGGFLLDGLDKVGSGSVLLCMGTYEVKVDASSHIATNTRLVIVAVGV